MKRVTGDRTGGLVRPSGNPVRVQAVQDLRRSNASGVHRARRATRSETRRAAIRESTDV